ncbi:MAG: HAMP domain-containing sensor histidine kinase [Coriobacteriia bacterium]|nr:HAMP domain-containing sensor histidine kinase [Coriobacteriia bacterium]
MFLALIVGELVFAIVMGVTIGVFTTLADVRQREEAVRQISSSIAAGLMPMIADQQITHVQAQLSSIVQTANVHDVIGIGIRDASGTEIAHQGAALTETPGAQQGLLTPLAPLLKNQVVVQPVVVDGLQVATVSILFSPPGMDSLKVPIIASVVVLLSVIVVSLPWTAWKLTTDVVEPLDELGAFATQIAEGDLDASPPTRRGGEIGELQETLGRMSVQLKYRDDQLRGSYSDLAKAYGDLDRAKHEIEQLAALKADFVAIAAHELRSPLTTITLYAELLETGALSELEPKALDAVEVIGSASARLGSIVSDLMDSALLERGLMPIQFGDVWVSELVGNAARDAQLMAQSHDITIRFEDFTPDTVIRGDALRLRQVLDNLLSNAVKYSPAGTQVDVRLGTDADFIDIEVADQGIGVSQGDKHVLFTLFGRVDSGDGRDTSGLGLGLAISARIVEAHGGHLTYRDNERGRGSVFCARLPRGGREADLPSTTILVVGEDRHE